MVVCPLAEVPFWTGCSSIGSAGPRVKKSFSASIARLVSTPRPGSGVRVAVGVIVAVRVLVTSTVGVAEGCGVAVCAGSGVLVVVAAGVGNWPDLAWQPDRMNAATMVRK